MKEQWNNYSDKFLQLTSREQFLVLLTGLVAIFFIISYFFIDDKSAKVSSFDKQSRAMVTGNKTLNFSQFSQSFKGFPIYGELGWRGVGTPLQLRIDWKSFKRLRKPCKKSTALLTFL